MSEKKSVLQKYVQKNVRVKAQKINSRVQIQTLEGPEIANPGDWLITGVRGEQWPVSDRTFKRKYEAVPGLESVYEKRAIVVEARQLQEPIEIDTPWGKQQGKTGDWLVEESQSEQHIVANGIFQDTYSRLKDN